MALVNLWLDKSIASDVRKLLEEMRFLEPGSSGSWCAISDLALTSHTLNQECLAKITETSKNETPKVNVFIFGTFPESGTLDPKIVEELSSGRIRIGFWGIQAESAKAEKWVKEGTSWFDIGMSVPVKKAVIHQLLRAAIPGVQGLLPAKSSVFSDRLTHGNEIGRKLDRAMTYLTDNRPAIQDTLPLRVALSAALALALKNKPTTPVVLQMGLASDYTVFTVRWKLDNPHSCDTFLQSNQAAIQAISTYSGACGVQLMREPGDVELVLIYSAMQSDGQEGLVFVDRLSGARISILMRAGEASRLRALGFKTYSSLPDKTIPRSDQLSRNPDLGGQLDRQTIAATLAQPAASGEKDENLDQEENAHRGDSQESHSDPANFTVRRQETSAELSNLKTEHERLTSNFEKMKEQATLLQRRLSDAMDEKKKLQQQIRTYEVQLTQAKSGKADTDSKGKREVESMKKTLEGVKARENEMIRKYAASVEENKKLQLEIKALRRKGAA